MKKWISMLCCLLVMTWMLPVHSQQENNDVLATPENLRIVELRSNGVDLQWDPVPGASAYLVYISTSHGRFFRVLTRNYTPRYTHTGLDPNTQYQYAIRAINADTQSVNSEVIIADTPALDMQNRVLGYAVYYYPGHLSSYHSINKNASSLTDVSMQFFTTDGKGNLTGNVPPIYTHLIRSNDLDVHFTVFNDYDREIAGTLLSSSKNRATLVQNIVQILDRYGFSGVNIDIENIPAVNRDHYTQLMKELSETLHPLGYNISAAVPAKTQDNPRLSWVYAFDYQAIGSYVDQVIIMTYDQHYASGRPGPIASIEWVRQVLGYATTVIPSEKILMGIATYGYDWPLSGRANAYQHEGIYRIATRNNASILWDHASKSPYYHYTDENGSFRTVWFEDHRSLAYKLELARSFDLGGIALWRLGGECNDFWDVLSTFD